MLNLVEMKNLSLLLLGFGIFFGSFGFKASAQSVGVEYDTVYLTAGRDTAITNRLNNLTSSNMAYNWKVLATDMPSEWLPKVGICDNIGCFTASLLYPSGAVKTTDPYSPGMGYFHINFDLAPHGSTAPYYITVQMYNPMSASDNAKQTYIVRPGASTVSVNNTAKAIEEITLYPNPAHNEVNVVFDAGADVKHVAIYNIIGKAVANYRVSGNSANLNIDNAAPGIYFVRLINSNGNVVATKKFTKQ